MMLNASTAVWECVDVLREHLTNGVPVDRVRAASFLSVLEVSAGDSILLAGIAAQAIIELARSTAERPS